MNTTAHTAVGRAGDATREEPSFDPSKVDEWVAEVQPAPAVSSASSTTRAPRRAGSSTPWVLGLGAIGAFGLLMAFQQVVEGSVRDAPLKRAQAERMASGASGCAAAGPATAGTVCSDLPISAVTPASRRNAGPAYAQLSP